MKRTALSQLARRTPESAISWLMKLTLERPDLISLAAGFTDNDSLPVNETRELLDDILRSPRTGRPALQYGATNGDAALREMTAAHLVRGDVAGQTPSSDTVQQALPPADLSARMLITSGSQQLLYITTEALCDEGDIVLVEDPTYFVYLGITQGRGLRTRGVRLLDDGIDLEHLEQVLDELKQSGELPRVKMLYLVTYFQNPTGRTTSFAKKAAALAMLQKYERAAGHPIYLLEDAAYRELRFAGEDIPSALATAHAGRVIYAGTYSKPFATGARVGFGVLPQDVFTAASRIKGNHDFGTANLLQQLLSRAMSSGAYEKYLPVLRQRYAAKAATMVRAIREHFPTSVKWAEPGGGLYVWAELPTRVKSGVKSSLFGNALKSNVLYVPGELCYCDDAARRKPNREMRISFGGARATDIPEGIKRLATVMRRCGVR
ncbi:MAG TPA: PLP-dependent aminotransferase family protein [Candidatus Acidoferrum sp.]|nr:PLP-dependent aminotransferase family protein [Candidatus Acidoferrum sp.]